MHLLGSTGVTTFERVAASAKRYGTRVILCGVRAEVAATLESSGVSAVYGAENIFKADDMLFESTYAALQRAKQAIAQSTRDGLDGAWRPSQQRQGED